MPPRLLCNARRPVLVDDLNPSFVATCGSLFFMRSPRHSVGRMHHVLACPVVTFVLLTRYSSRTAWRISTKLTLAPTDELIRFCRSKVKITAGRQGQILWTPYLKVTPRFKYRPMWWLLAKASVSTPSFSPSQQRFAQDIYVHRLLGLIVWMIPRF